MDEFRIWCSFCGYAFFLFLEAVRSRKNEPERFLNPLHTV